MKLQVEMQLSEIFGGDGNIRIQQMEETKLSRKKKKSSMRESIGVEVDDTVTEKNTVLMDREINTFKEIDEKPVLRLGGVHGKLWGALKSTGLNLAEIGDKNFPSKAMVNRIMNLIQINPVYIPVGEKNWRQNGTKLEPMFQAMNTGFGSNKSHVTLYFDVIDQAKINFEVTFPDVIQTKVETLIKGLEIGGHLNKRRTTIEILNITKAS